MMKPDVRVLNFARGGLIDDEAMMKAMDEGKIGAYVTDFATEDLLKYPQVIGVPHLGASTPVSYTHLLYTDNGRLPTSHSCFCVVGCDFIVFSHQNIVIAMTKKAWLFTCF